MRRILKNPVNPVFFSRGGDYFGSITAPINRIAPVWNRGSPSGRAGRRRRRIALEADERICRDAD